MFRSFFTRLFGTVLPGSREQRLNEEIEEHLDELAARQAARGLGPKDARLTARREFGPVEPVKELYRDQARFRALENIFRDLRFAIRQCRKNPSSERKRNIGIHQAVAAVMYEIHGNLVNVHGINNIVTPQTSSTTMVNLQIAIGR